MRRSQAHGPLARQMATTRSRGRPPSDFGDLVDMYQTEILRYLCRLTGNHDGGGRPVPGHVPAGVWWVHTVCDPARTIARGSIA